MRFVVKNSTVTFALITLIGSIWGLGCSSTQKKPQSSLHSSGENSALTLSALNGKKVALVSIDSGEPSSRKIVEVALINQLVQRGTFELISKKDVEDAKKSPNQDPTDWKGIAKQVGADYALTANVLQFDAVTHEGYSAEEMEDSQLAEEQGTDGKTKRVFKVRSLEGSVKIAVHFTHLKDGHTDTGIAKAEERVESSARTSSALLPPKMRFLENLTNKAFREFFNQYN